MKQKLMQKLAAMAFAAIVSTPALAYGDPICNRSPWVDAALLTSSGIEFAVGHVLGKASASIRVQAVASRAARFASWSRGLTFFGIASIVAEGALMYYDNNYC